MKTSLHYSLLIAAAGFAGLASQANAVSLLSEGDSFHVASQNNGGSTNFDISVNPSYAGYSGVADPDNSGATPAVPVDGTFAGTITNYRFWNNGDGADESIDTYASLGTIIGDASTADLDIANSSGMNLWTTNDPNGGAFDTDPANFTNPSGISALSDIAGDINITGLTSGRIYFLYGGYRSGMTLGVTMSGSGTEIDQSIVDIHNGDFSNNFESYIAYIDFTNEDAFTTISYDAAWDTNFNGRWSGIIVTAVPEPSSLALLGLCGLALLRRRR